MLNETYATLIGIAVQTALYLLGGYGLVVRNDTMVKALMKDIQGMQDELKQLSNVITAQAVQTTRIDAMMIQVASLERRLEDLRRGAGWVQHRKSVDGEYP